MEVLCETEECFMDGDLYERLEDQYYRAGIPWRPKNNSVFWGHSMQELISKRLGTKLPEEQDKKVTKELDCQAIIVIGGSIAHWIAYLLPHPAALGSNHSSRVFFRKKFRCCCVDSQHTAYTTDCE